MVPYEQHLSELSRADCVDRRLMAGQRLALANHALSQVTCSLMLCILVWNFFFIRSLNPLHMSLTLILCHLTLHHRVWWGLLLLLVLALQTIGVGILLWMRPCISLMIMHSSLLWITGTAIFWFRCAYRRHRALRELCYSSLSRAKSVRARLLNPAAGRRGFVTRRVDDLAYRTQRTNALDSVAHQLWKVALRASYRRRRCRY